MKKETVIAIVIGMLFIALFFVGYRIGNSYSQALLDDEKAKIEEKYQETITKFQSDIASKDAALRISEQQKGVLQERLRRKEAELASIKPPANRKEIIDRLKGAGYEIR